MTETNRINKAIGILCTSLSVCLYSTTLKPHVRVKLQFYSHICSPNMMQTALIQFTSKLATYPYSSIARSCAVELYIQTYMPSDINLFLLTTAEYYERLLLNVTSRWNSTYMEYLFGTWNILDDMDDEPLMNTAIISDEIVM